MDEKYIHVKKEHGYDLNVIDHKTKYILSHSFVEERTKEAVTEFLRKIKTTCYEQILEVYQKEKHKKMVKKNLERACQENVSLMALPCGPQPDHSMIAAFVHR